MKNRTKAMFAVATILLSLFLAACGGGKLSADDLKTYRDISWEGTELTVKLGTNKTTGCEWKNAFGDKGNWQLKSYPGLTHPFTAGKKTEGSAAYMKDEKMDAQVILDIAEFVNGIR